MTDEQKDLKVENQKEAVSKPKMEVKDSQLVAGSIVLAGVLISASLLYGNNLLLNKLSGLSLSGGSGAVVENGTQEVQPQLVKYETRQDIPLVGNSRAKVTMVEFSDFECPFCQRFYKETYGSLKSKYIDNGKVKLEFRHFPLPFHPNAQKAAEAGECAAKQGKFSQYHDMMFSKGGNNVGLTIADLKSYAKTLGLNASNFNSCLDKGDTATVVSGDLAEGQKIGVSGTPGFLIFTGDVKDVEVDVALVNQKLQQGQNVIEFASGATMIIGALPTATFEQVLDAKLK